MPLTDHTNPFAEVRNSFPGALTAPYFDVSARGLLYDGARRTLDHHLEQCATGSVDKKELFAGVEKTRSLFAQLIRADADEIAFTRNVTDGIAIFAASLPWKPGDNVVLCESIEHPANIFPWHGLSRRHGIGIKTLPQRDGRIELADVLAQIDARTRVVALSTVSFSPGFRAPVAELGAECRKRGVLLVVDAAQSVGVLDTDVTALNVDALSVSTQKYLMGLYGLGLLYVRKSLAETLDPILLSRFGVDSDGHEANAGDAAAYKLGPGARRFDVGNYNYPAILAVGSSLELLLRLGSQAVETYVCGLAHMFANRMIDASFPVYGGRPGPHQGHIITIGRALGIEHDAANDVEMADLHAFLIARGIRFGIRRNLLRFSFHIYNNIGDIDKTIDLAQQWRENRERFLGR